MLDATRSALADPWLAAWAAEIPQIIEGLSNAFRAGRLTEPVVHKSRRELKKLRSLLRLAPASATDFADETREITGELRRRLGQTRDATVMLKTLSSLSGDLGEAATRIKPVLSAHHRIAAAALHRGSRRGDRDRIVRLGAIWRRRPTAGDVADLRRQAAKTYRRARKRATALRHGKEAALHPLRKAVVDHQNHLAFFAGADKGKIATRHKKVRRLRDQLGLCNDLEVLRDFVRTRADISGGDLIKLEEVLAKRHRLLVGKAVKLSATLFDDKPRGFAKLLRLETGKARDKPRSTDTDAGERPAGLEQ
ncbi:CHAD domain-containing protein [Rhizobiales bacterium GAS113]|jgi:CHAD domain-containing protein|nr:CHAD domain-containing protein [Rhizobiales bacterium GAS113]